MNFFIGRSVFVVLAFCWAMTSQAQPLKLADNFEQPAAEPLVSPELEQRIFSRIKSSRPELHLSDLEPSPIPGLYKIYIDGNLAFVSEDGGYLIAGEMYEVQEQGLVNLQLLEREERSRELMPIRIARLKAIDAKDMVIYTPETEVKGHVYVFTDIDCGFCRRLHSGMKEMLDMGIEVRYLAFPRAGVHSRSADKLATTWCSDDPQETMTRFKQGKNVKLAVCDDHPVAKQYQLAQELGVAGTPAIILESGEMIPGAVSPEALADRMGI